MKCHARSTRPSQRSLTGICAKMPLVLALLLGAWSARADAQSTGGISGTVTDAGTGAPLAGVYVTAFNSSGSSVGSASTNASGVYTKTGLVAGTYYVKTYNDAGYVDELYDNLPCPGTTCYPFTTGTGVNVTAGATTIGIDFRLAVGGAITGTVTDAATGAPLAGVSPNVYTVIGGTVRWAGLATTNASGVYTVTGLPADTYYVWTANHLGYVDELYDNLPCPDEACTVTTGTGVSVTAGATTSGIDFGLALPRPRRTLLYLKAGDPAAWTTPGAAGSQGREILQWQSAGYTVTTRNLLTTTVTASLLAGYEVLRLNGAWHLGWAPTEDEGLAIDEWVRAGGRLLAEVPVRTGLPAVSRFGVSTIDGANGGASGLDWYYHGSPWILGPVSGPTGSVSSVAASAMDRPVLSSGHALTVDAVVDGYPAVVHGQFGSGRVVMVFMEFWSHDAPYAGHAYNATIYQAGNLQFLSNCIQYLRVAPQVGDFTGDLKSDILWRHTTGGDVWLWPMDGAARTAETYVRTVPDTNWETRGLGDQTGDGKADVLWRHKITGAIYLWPMNGSTPLSETYVATVDPAYDTVGTGDFDGDGKADILWRHLTNGEVWIWLMDGATSISRVYVGMVDPAYAIKGVGDLDGDGLADIVWHHATAGEVWVWLMDGTTRLSATWVGTVPDVGYQIAGVADYDGDAKADLLWHHATTGEVWLWRMDGATRLAETWVGTVPDTDYKIVGTGDYDGDGNADILWHHATLGEVWVWLMDGATRLSQTWVGTVPDVGYKIVKVR